MTEFKPKNKMKNIGPLGLSTDYISTYSPELLFPVPRELGRSKSNIPSTPLPFSGVDIWNGFEISWLNLRGKPQVAIGTFYFPCTSSHIIESKSFKLYLNSFNQSQFASRQEVEQIMKKDLSKASCSDVKVELYEIFSFPEIVLNDFSAICIDHIDIDIDHFHPESSFLSTSNLIVKESLSSHLFKSNCLATGQPDWASILISYQGLKINHEGLLKYLISYRNHAGFHEHCIEQIFQDISTYCKPEKLTVYGRYTRRGGLDINPFRSNDDSQPMNQRLVRQ